MFKYPEHPLSNRGDPFRDEQGKNPFADEAPPASAPSANPYVPTGAGNQPTYRPEYEATLSHRGRLVFRLGLWGFLGTLLGAGGGTVMFLTGWSASGTALAFWTMLLLGGACLAWPAWLMGRSDLAAMRAGAMDREGWRPTRRGHALGAVGTLIALPPLVYLLVQLYLWTIAYL
jgi:hypothetical protein